MGGISANIASLVEIRRRCNDAPLQTHTGRRKWDEVACGQELRLTAGLGNSLLYLASIGPRRFVPTANSSIHSVWACGSNRSMRSQQELVEFHLGKIGGAQDDVSSIDRQLPSNQPRTMPSAFGLSACMSRLLSWNMSRHSASSRR